MKLKFSILLIICAISFAGYSQIRVRPGVKLGLNASKLSNIDDIKRKNGLEAAMFVNVRFTDFYQFQLESGYSNNGLKWEDDLFGDGEINLNYISLGIANKFFFSNKMGLHFIMGPNIDILIDDDTDLDTTPIDLSFNGGIGYEFPFGFGLEVVYKQGIIDVFDDDFFFDDDENNLNSIVKLSAFYTFNFK